MASSRDTPSRARLTITRDHPSETISSLADLVQALDGLTVSCGWLSIVAQQALEPGEWLTLHQHLRAEGAEGSKARDRFYPWFGNELTASIPPITLASWNEFLGSREVIDPGDPLDIGLQYSLNAWFRNSLRQIGDKADDRVFAFAAVKRIQHESPILVETIITGGVAFYSHTIDVVPATTPDFHESVPATISIHAPRSIRLGQFFTFSGQLTGGYIPAGGEEVQVQIRYGGRWRELQLVDTNSRGQWKYRYAFTLEPGTRWAFRAIAVRNGSYPFTSPEAAPSTSPSAAEPSARWARSSLVGGGAW